MKALLLSVGSQGDVRPFLALAKRLREEGHEAVIAAPALHRGLAEAHRVPMVSLDLDMLRVADEIQDAHGFRHFLRFAGAMGRQAAKNLPRLAEIARSDLDVVVHHPLLPVGHHLAEFAGARSVVGMPTPAVVPTSQFPSAVWGTRFGGANRLSYRVAGHMTRRSWGRELDRWRHDDLGLPRRVGWRDPLRRPDGKSAPVLHGFSPLVVPRPADWPDSEHTTGYWTLREPDYQPSRRLTEFLEAGEPPVYIGFGSMPIDDPRRLVSAIIEATARIGTRALISSGYKGLRGITNSDRLHVVRHAPHDWLFPRCSAVVHHGGAGTTGAAAIAGRPQAICPVGLDQPFWAQRMCDLGVASPAPMLHRLDQAGLTRTLDSVLHDPGLRRRASELGSRLSTEDGTGRAVELLLETTHDRQEAFR